MKTVKQTAQQGDVIFRKLGAIPKGEAVTVGRGRCVVAHGESGHSHVIDDDEAELIQIGGRMILSLGKASIVQHDEHKAFRLEPGIWEVGRIQEYDYIGKITRPVQD